MSAPRHIAPRCPQCRASLVLWDQLDAPQARVVFADEYVCPECRDRVYPDRPDLPALLAAADTAYQRHIGSLTEQEQE